MSVRLENFRRGDTLELTLTFTNALTGAVINVSGWELWLTMKTNLTDLDAAAVLQHQMTVPSDANATNGIAIMTVTSTETDITPGTYHYDIQRAIAGSPPDVQTLVTGRVTVKQDVTLENA